MAPLSKWVPPSALSNLWTGKAERTPSAWNSSSCWSIWAVVHLGGSRNWPQPNGSDVSIPSTIASLPSLITRRAWVGLRTIRSQPLPGPPFWAST